MALISNIKLPDGSKHGIRALGIPYAEVDSTSTSTAYTATIPGITELVDGTCILLKNGVVTSAANFTININGLGAKPSYNNMATGNDVTPTAPTRDTTIFNINYTMLFVYSSTLVDGGAWICYRGYDANTNTLGYQLRTNSYVLNAADGFRYYVILFTSADGTKWVPANTNKSNSATTAKTVNQTPINPFGEIVYCGNSTNYSAGSAVTASAIWQEYTVTLGYSFNKTGAALTLTTKKPVYVKCTPQIDGSAIIDSTTPYVQDLPTTDDDKIYILLGMAYSATAIELLMNHPVYYYKDGAIRVWTNAPEVDSELNSESTNPVENQAIFNELYELGAYANGHEYVDLGLPSGTLWATVNIGAESSTDNGNYYAWGEITTKGSYDWNNYKYGQSASTFTKYNSTDGKTELDLEDDVAQVLWGGNWHMPTETQFQELIDNCTSSAVRINNKDCLKFESLNGLYIIIPRSGERDSSQFYDESSEGTALWSSSKGSNTYARALNFYVNNNSLSYCMIRDKMRYIGMTIRPVLNVQYIPKYINKIEQIINNLSSEKVHVYQVNSNDYFEDLSINTVINGVTETDLINDIQNGIISIIQFVVNGEVEHAVLSYSSISSHDYYFYNVYDSDIFSITLGATASNPTLRVGSVSSLKVADNTKVVHKSSTETITGNKTFTGTVSLGSNATATTPAAGDNDTSVATTAFVQNAVNSLPTPMQFKGSLGTGGTYTSSTIPAAAAANKGWTLKVITNGTYQSVVAKAGDTLISDGSAWILIPSGDEPSGTVTSVGLSMPTGFSVSNSPITSSGTLSVSMASGYTIPTNSQVNCWNCKISENSLKLSGNYTSNSIFSGNSTPVANNDTFETAIAKLDKIILDDELVSAAAFANLNVRLNCHSTKISGMEGNIVTVSGTASSAYCLANNAYSIANNAINLVCNLNYAPLCSPGFTGTPTAPTPINSSNNTLIDTTAFVNTTIYCSLSALCDFATKNYICSCLIPQIGHGFEDIDERFDNNSLVVSSALNDLNDKVTILSDEISNIDTSELQDLIDQLDAVVGAGLNDLNDNKLDKLNWDTTPTANSYNPVYSGGIKTELNKKQATLVSGTNIKTVNGCSLLGSGNITIQGGGGTVTSVGLSMPTGFTVSSTPITTNGTISVTMTSGYAIPTTTQVTCWNNKVSNVLSDWNATSGSAVILNKPTVISSIGYNSPGGYLTANSSNAVQLTVCSSNGRKLNIGGSTWQFTSTTEPSASADKSLIAPTWSAMTSAVSGKADAVSATTGTYRSVTVNSQGLVTAGTNPTTLSGYGITDAKIASGTITLGSNTITPLTSHQTLKTINSTAITGSGNISIPVVANLNAPNSLPSGASGTGVTISSTNYYLVSDKPYCTSSDVNAAPSWSAIQSCLSAVRTEMASSGGVTIYSGSSTPSSSLGSNGDIYIQTT